MARGRSEGVRKVGNDGGRNLSIETLLTLPSLVDLNRQPTFARLISPETMGRDDKKTPISKISLLVLLFIFGLVCQYA